MRLSKADFATDRHGWAEFLPERRVGNILQGTHRVPWVVIGAGFTGLACARRLGELYPDADIILLDARLVGQGASGRNSGFAVAVSQFPGAYSPKQIPEQQRINMINQAGVNLLRSQIEANSIDCQWDESGFHYGAADRYAIEECRNFLEFLDSREVPHTRLDQQALRQRLGTDHYKTGLHVSAGALVQPASLVRGLADNLPENVALYEQSPVLKVQQGVPVTLNLVNGTIVADNVMIATNYEAGKIGFINRYLIGSTLTGSFTRKLTEDELASLGSLKQWGLLSLHGGGATVRLTADGRICLRNTAEYNGGKLISDAGMIERQFIHRKSFDLRFPQLADVPFEYSWSGVEGISRNGTNFFGSQGNNIYLAGGYNGSGVSRGTAFGTALAEYASGGQSKLISNCLACKSATWMPPRPLLDIGAAYTVRSRFKGVGLDR